MVKKQKYSFLIGLKKAGKNVLITVGVPALVVLLNEYVQWMPASWYNVGVPVVSVSSYLVKNYFGMKQE